MITKEQFLAAYNKYPPSGFVKFMFRYFSINTRHENSHFAIILSILLIIFFLAGFIGTILHYRTLIGIVTLVYCFLVFVVVICMAIAALINRRRLKKVIALLGITRKEYDQLAMQYITD